MQKFKNMSVEGLALLATLGVIALLAILVLLGVYAPAVLAWLGGIVLGCSLIGTLYTLCHLVICEMRYD